MLTRIILTGSGFLGRHLHPLLAQNNEVYPVSSQAYDLRQQSHIDALFKHFKPDVVYHLAAHVGGIHYNVANPAILYYDNVMMNTQLIHKAALSGVKKFIFVSSACIYSANCPTPMRTHMIWDDYPEPTNGTYGLSKRIALPQLEAYYEQFGMRYEYPILSNMYGPGDDFSEERSHVIPALIKRFLKAKKEDAESVTIWGSGRPTRDFLYVTEAAEILAMFLDNEVQEPLNIANGFNIRIARLAEMIAEIVGYQGDIEFDASKPDGQMNRAYDVLPAKQELGWEAKIDIKEGLKKTVEWYKGRKIDDK